MSKFTQVSYNTDKLMSFEHEWLCHKKCREWWYATGYLNDENQRLYSYQFTLLRLNFGVIPYVLMVALTDFQTGKHHYYQKATLSEKNITISDTTLIFADTASVRKEGDCMKLRIKHSSFELELRLDYGKGAFWHCDNGRLQMGIPGQKETTLYYSYTNMPTTGTLSLFGERARVTGKSWFDKQGGPYSILNTKCMWEWFSLRFFDDEEVMLFSFPQDDYYDGTYIKKDCTSQRLNNYVMKATEFTYVNDVCFSCEWTVFMPGIKQEQYTIKPLGKGQLNLAYFELLAGIYNADGEKVGLCFVELLPGVRNDKINPLNLFKKVN